MKSYRFSLLIVIGFSLFSTSLKVNAQNRVVVVPLLGDVAGLQNIVTVSRSGGDFTNVSSALNSIQNASPSNPYLIVVGPGVYSIAQTIVMKDSVSIMGSGPETTVLSGFVSSSLPSDSAIIRASSNSRISNMTIRNLGGGRNLHSIGILNNNTRRSIISGVNIEISGGSVNNTGIFNDRIADETVSISDSSILVLGGNSSGLNTGITSSFSSLKIKGIDIIVRGIGLRNVGVQDEFSGTEVGNSQLTVQGSGDAFGVRIIASTPADSGFVLVLQNSKVNAQTAGLSAIGAGIQVTRSSLSGGATTNGGGTFVCVNSDNGNGVELGEECQVMN